MPRPERVRVSFSHVTEIDVASSVGEAVQILGEDRVLEAVNAYMIDQFKTRMRREMDAYMCRFKFDEPEV